MKIKALIAALTIATLAGCAPPPPQPTPPSTPKCLSAAAGPSSNSVKLDWDDSVWSSGSTNRRYEVHEDLFNGRDNLVATVTVSGRTSGSVAPGNYRYYVIAKDSTGTAPSSPKVTVRVPVAGPVYSPASCGPTPTSTTTSTTTTTTTPTTTTPPTSTTTSTMTTTPTTTTTPPPPPAWPNPNNTGVPAGWVPQQTIVGNYTVSTPGQVVQDIRVDGDIRVNAPNVTLRRVEVRGGAIDNYNNGTCSDGLLIEDSSIINRPGLATSGDDPVIYDAGYTARRVKIDGPVEGFRVSGKYDNCDPVVIEDSFARVVYPSSGGCDWHGDTLQGYIGVAVTVKRTTMEMVESPSCTGTSPFFYTAGVSDNTRADIDGLLVIGGGYSFRLSTPATVRNLMVKDRSWGYGPMSPTNNCSIITTWQASVVTVDANYQPTGVVRSLPTCTSS